MVDSILRGFVRGALSIFGGIVVVRRSVFPFVSLSWRAIGSMLNLPWLAHEWVEIVYGPVEPQKVSATDWDSPVGGHAGSCGTRYFSPDTTPFAGRFDFVDSPTPPR